MPRGIFLLGALLAACSLDVSPTDLAGGGGGGSPPPETVFFSIDILPLFQADCTLCHGGAGGLNLDSWGGVIAGGNSGDVLVAGDPQSSLIIRRLNGDLPPIMPLDAPPFAQPEIDRIAQWIMEGARNN